MAEEKKIWIKYLRNKYFITFVIFLAWIMFFNEVTIFNLFSQKALNRKIESEIELFDNKTRELKQRIKTFKTNKDSIEKFARENYYMKRDNEDVYIFD